MNAYDTPDQESTALEPPRHVPLGTDSAGATHHHAACDDRIYVIAADGALELVVDIEATPLPDWHAWIDHVRQQDDWADLTVAAVVAGAFGGD